MTAFFFTSCNGYLNARWLFKFAPHRGTGWFADPRFIVGALLAPFIVWVLRSTRWGMIVRMVGDSADAARAMGYSVDVVRLLATIELSLAAMLIATAAINEGFDATHIPSYGPESRGGTSYADVHVASEEVLSPASPAPHILVAFNAPSLTKFGPQVTEGGVVVYDEHAPGHRPLSSRATPGGRLTVRSRAAKGPSSPAGSGPITLKSGKKTP